MLHIRHAEAAFAATHAIPELPGWHMCAKVHGHDWRVVLELTAPTAEMLPGPDIEAELRRWCDQTLRTRFLNDPVGGAGTLENVAMWIYDQWAPRYPHLAAVRVSASQIGKVLYWPGGTSTSQ